MRSAEAFKQDTYDYLMEQVQCDPHIDFCHGCPYLRHEEDTGAYDCEFGGDIESCAYSPSVELQAIADEIYAIVSSARPA